MSESESEPDQPEPKKRRVPRWVWAIFAIAMIVLGIYYIISGLGKL
ncbi:MAG: hypothetical protein ACFFBV_09320 [Promethearchaeota archaeon]